MITTLNIICIDDDYAFLKSLESLLPNRINNNSNINSLQYYFDFIDDPLEAIERIKEINERNEELSMIITDQKMPNLKGTDLLDKIKDIFPETIKVLLTGHAGLDSAIAAINNDTLDKYLVKPISDIEDFVITIKKLLNEYDLKKRIKIQNSIINNQIMFIVNLNTKPSIEETFDYIINFSKNILLAHQVLIFLENNGNYILNSGLNINPDLLYNLKISSGNPLIEMTLKNNSAFILEDINKFHSFGDDSFLSSVSPALLVRLMNQDKPMGIIIITNKEEDRSFTERDIQTLSYISNSASIAINNQQSKLKLEQTNIEIIKSLASTVEEKDPYTKGHSLRVRDFSICIAKEMGLDDSFLKIIDMAGILHDIGKIGIPEMILNKPGKLTEEEYSLIKLHPIKGETIIKPIGFLKEVIPIIRSHHERFNGKGYPDGLMGEDIPLGSRILAIADTYDAMTSTRAYREALSNEIAFNEILRVKGEQLDPRCIEAFCRCFNKNNMEDK